MITDQKALCRDVPETPLVLWAPLPLIVCHQGGGSLADKNNAAFVVFWLPYQPSGHNIASAVLVSSSHCIDSLPSRRDKPPWQRLEKGLCGTVDQSLDGGEVRESVNLTSSLHCV